MANVTLTDLNYWTKQYHSGRIRPTTIVDNTLYPALRLNLSSERYKGDAYEGLIQTKRGMNARATGRGKELPVAQAPGWVKWKTAYAEIEANAGVTSQDLNAFQGTDAGWERLPARLLEDLRTKDFAKLLNEIALGDGTGRLARANGTETYDGGADTLIIRCDNTYYDWGWENVALIQPDMWVELYTAAGVIIATSAGATSFRVTNVYFTDRNNGGAVTPSDSVAAFKIEGVDSDITATLDDNGIIYRAGSKSQGLTVSDAAGTAFYDAYTCYPMGLTGLVGDGSHQKFLTKFQNVTRATYDLMNAGMYDAADFASGGSGGTPDTWDLSDITAIMEARKKVGGKYVSDLFCTSELAMCISRLNRSESGVNVVVSSTADQNQAAAGSEIAKGFIRPDGKVIPIHVSATIPRNVLYGVCAEDLFMLTDGDFGYVADSKYGHPGPWMHRLASRIGDFECPFGGLMQIAAEACNNNFCVMDLKDNI